ncbi:MAG: Na+/H+ antiporter NhaA type [uncultured Rubrobacteraceae bacterium]|uniref:Na(+)/H(+) antiporter NhaA n=1 Tax=uncultured Rubrobacteraceae bacterium TaxID=349277 RepID=A0A6J4QTC4_9ACTN|nr:MAG: Na+/H+ antiporter NhaA type [uncultured Rubrobacteraceae bacterium]
MGVKRVRPVEKIVRPFQAFADRASSGGILLIVTAIVALVWSNSPWGESYTGLWGTELSVGLGPFSIEEDLTHWINDGLMAVFFLVVGLEIKREILVGELSSPRRAALPLAAAVGGAVLPALIYVLITFGTEGVSGWGIPMATDIAFALGVLALLGRRAPLGLKVFLTALAIVDDILAVLVIALFYTSDVSWGALALGGVFLIALVTTNLAGVGKPLPYGLLGIGLWLCFLESGVHATIAGVLLAMTVPASSFIDTGVFLKRSRGLLDRFEQAGEQGGDPVLCNEERQGALHALNRANEDVEPPLQELEHALHPWVVFAIMPLFALANAGVVLGEDFTSTLLNPVSVGILAGLLLGKQVGVTLFAWLAVKSGISEMPQGVTWLHIYGAGWLAGIGFTMSLFISDLAFAEGPLLDVAKLGILTASIIAGIMGWSIIRITSAPRTGGEEEEHPD